MIASQKTKRRYKLLKSNRTMYCLLILAMTIIICSNYANAAVLDENNQTISLEHTNPENDLEIAETEDMNIANEENTKHIAKKKGNANTKENEELQDITLHVDDLECDYGDSVDINVVTTPEVDDGVLSFYVDDRLVGARNLSNSAASYSLQTGSYMPGTYELTVSYSASLNYANNHTTSTLKINKVESEIRNISMHFNDENDIAVHLNVMGKNQEQLDFGTLNVYYGDELITGIEIEDYDVEFTLDKCYNREVLRFEYVGDEYYSNAAANELIYVEKYSMNIHLPYLTAYHSSIISQTLTFYSEHPVNDGKVNVYIDGVLVDQIQVSSENVEINIDSNNYPIGNYLVYIEYVDSDVYSDCFYQTTLTIKKIATTTYTYNITAHKNEIIDLRAYVYNYVDQTDEGMLEFLIDNESVKTAMLTNGTITENYLIPDSMEYGQHDIQIIYHGSQKYQDSQAEATLNIVKHSNSLSLKNYTLDDNGSILINIRAYSYNNTVDDGQLELYVNGTLISITNVTDNITCLRLPDEYAADNDYVIELRYRNSEKYDDTNLTVSISPERYNTTTRVSGYINSQNVLNVTAHVYSTKYSEISEGSVSFYINDTLIATKQIAENRASILYDMENMDEGEYILKAEYTGTKSYRNSENSTGITFRMNRKSIYVSANSSIKARPGQTIHINAKLTDYEGNAINLNTTSRMRILDENLDVDFIEGELNHEYTIDTRSMEGTSDIIIEVPETKYYKNGTKIIRLTIMKDSPYITAPNSIRSNKYETIQLNATLSLNGETISDNVTGIVKINNKTIYQGKFINGVMEYKLILNENYKNDNYSITIKSQETATCHSAEKTIALNLNGRKTYITSQNIVSKNGDRIIIEANIFDMITRDYVKGTSKACIKINEVTLENINVTNGHLLYSYVNDYSAKNYSITIIYGENGIYNSSKWEGTLTIEAKPLQILTNNIKAPAYSEISIKARVLDGNEMASGVIKSVIKINNKTIIEENVTDGNINMAYRLPDEMGAGEYNLTIIAGDSRQYMNAMTTAKLIVTKNYKQIKAGNITARTNESIRILADIVDENDEPVNRTTRVNIKLAGRSIADLNVSDGKIAYDYVLPENVKAGTYDLLIQAGENSGYYHATTNSVLKVE